MSYLNFVELNEHGLNAMDKRQYERAVNIFRHAITHLNRERTGTPEPLGTRTCSFHAVAIPLDVSNVRGISFAEQTASQDGHFVLYDYAYSIEYHDVFFAYPYAVTTLLYNIAVALHVDALSVPSRFKLNQAKEIYNKALNFFLVKSGKSLLEDTRHGELRSLMLALVNNYGHTCALLSDAAGVERAQAHLQTLFSDDFTDDFMEPDEDTFFRMTLLVGVLKGTLSSMPAVA